MNGILGRARDVAGRDAAAAGLVITWSAGFIGAEFGTQAGAAPFTLLSWRFVLLTVLLVVACLVSRTSLRSWPAWKRQIGLGLLCQAGYLGFVFVGISHGVHGGTAALIAALQPLLVMTVAGRLLGEAPSRLAWLGTSLGFLGVVIVVSADIGAAEAPAWAYVFPTVAMLSLTIGTVLSKRIKPPETLLQTITMQAALSAVVFTAAAVIAGQAQVPANTGTWAAIAWLILVPSIAGYGLYVFVTHASGATVVSTLLYLTPPTTMLWAYLMFGDPIYLAGVVGLLVSGLGVIIVLRTRRQHPTAHSFRTRVTVPE